MSYIKGKRVALSHESTEESIAFAEYCRELFEYREDGSLIRRVGKSNIKAGTVAGSLSNRGYLCVSTDNVTYLVHQIVFLLHYNYIPKTIDHIDRDKINNRIENLRSVTTRENNLNTCNNIDTPNIYKKGRGYQVRFTFNGEMETFGTYKTLEEAITIKDKIANDLGNWQTYLPVKTKDKPNRYITKNGSGYRIKKSINGHETSFGSYKTLEEAIVVRDALEENNWVLKDFIGPGSGD